MGLSKAVITSRISSDIATICRLFNNTNVMSFGKATIAVTHKTANKVIVTVSCRNSWDDCIAAYRFINNLLK